MICQVSQCVSKDSPSSSRQVAPISPQLSMFIEEGPVIIESEGLAMTPATKPGFDPHDASTCTPISDWQDRGDHSVHCPLQLCSQGSEVRLDLAQLMLLYCATRVLPAPTAALP